MYLIFPARSGTLRSLHPLKDERVPDSFRKSTISSFRQARRLVVLVLGASVVLVGVAMLVLPGPGMVVIPLGLAILAIEFAWARRWLKRIGKTAHNLRENFTGTGKSETDSDRDELRDHEDTPVAPL